MAQQQADESTALLSGIQIDNSPDGGRSLHRTNLRRRSSAAFPPCHEDLQPTENPSSSLTIYLVVPISLLGVFVANADSSLIVASSQQIASEFNELYNAQWLITSYVLAQCASQPLYGKLSNVFGRKINLVAAYTLFAVGCFLCGVGSTFAQILAGRAISGVGGAGLTTLVSIIIADLVPVRDVAAWLSYVNVIATTGRALGGPIGGWLCDTVGWRWCFYGQVPPSILGLLLIIWKMPAKTTTSVQVEDQPLYQKCRRIDIVGAVTLALAISTFLLTLEFAARDLSPLRSVVIGILFLALSATFCLTEQFWAKEPILPLRLLVTRAALTSYLLAGFQTSAQFGLFYSTPLYYQLAAGSNVTQAGLRLVPAVVGNVTAGLLAGLVISRTGRYRLFTILASAFACTGYTLVVIRWHGSTNWFETAYIFCGGFGTGAIGTTTFIHLATSLDPEDMAIAGSTLYLANNLFLLVGLQSATTIQHVQLRGMLESALDGNSHKKEIIELAISSVQSIRLLPGTIKAVVIRAYIDSLSWAFGGSVIYAALGLVTAISMRECAM